MSVNLFSQNISWYLAGYLQPAIEAAVQSAQLSGFTFSASAKLSGLSPSTQLSAAGSVSSSLAAVAASAAACAVASNDGGERISESFVC